MTRKNEEPSKEFMERVAYGLEHWIQPDPKPKTAHLETEPIFGIHIEFCDGSKPIEYFNLNLKQTAVVLQEWSEEWILIPEKDCQLNGTMWNWHANVRHCDKSKPKDEPRQTEEPVELYFREVEED